VAAGLRVLAGGEAQAGPITVDVGGEGGISAQTPAFWSAFWVVMALLILFGFIRIGFRGAVAS
jgi:hypothetical protein